MLHPGKCPLVFPLFAVTFALCALLSHVSRFADAFREGTNVSSALCAFYTFLTWPTEAAVSPAALFFSLLAASSSRLFPLSYSPYRFSSHPLQRAFPLLPDPALPLRNLKSSLYSLVFVRASFYVVFFPALFPALQAANRSHA